MTFRCTKTFDGTRPIRKRYVNEYADEAVGKMHFIDAKLQVYRGFGQEYALSCEICNVVCSFDRSQTIKYNTYSPVSKEKKHGGQTKILMSNFSCRMARGAYGELKFKFRLCATDAT